MEVTVEVFRKWVVELEDKVSDSRGQGHSVWVFPAPICAVRYIKDARYLEGEKEGTESRGLEARKPHVQLGASRTV